MRVVGIRRDGGEVEVAVLSADGRSVTVLAPLDDFWAAPFDHLGREPAERMLSVRGVEFVPPVPRQARVICIGLNYRKHVAEGSFAADDMPPYPTLFAPGHSR